VTANNLEGRPYNFSFNVITVSSVPAVSDAFAIPAGTVFLTARAMKRVESESELAGILAREIAHITSRHVAQRMMALQADDRAYHGVGGGVMGGAIGYGVGRPQQKKYSFLTPSEHEKSVADGMAQDYIEQAGFKNQKSSSRDFKTIRKRLVGKGKI